MKNFIQNAIILISVSLSLASCGDPAKEESSTIEGQKKNVNFYNLNVDEMNKITPKFHAFGFQLRATDHEYANFEVMDVHALPYAKCTELSNILSKFIHHGNQALAGAKKEGKDHVNNASVRSVYNATKEAEFYFAQIDCKYELSVVEGYAEVEKIKAFKEIEYKLMQSSDFQFQNVATGDIEMFFFDQKNFQTEAGVRKQLNAIETFLFEAKALNLTGQASVQSKIKAASSRQTELLDILNSI